MQNLTGISCGTGILPDVDFTAQNILPVPLLSQVSILLIVPLGAAQPADWQDPSSFNPILGGTGGNSTGRYLPVMGELPFSLANRGILGRDHHILTHRVFTLDCELVTLCEQRFNLIQFLQTNWTSFTFWAITAGGRLIGGARGIRPRFVDAGVAYSRGRTDVEKGKIVLEWIANGDAGRAYVGEGGGGGGGGGGGVSPPFPPPDDSGVFQLYAQFFNNSVTSALVWTQNGGALPASPNTNVHVFQNGNKLNPTIGQYTITAGTPSGASTININVHFSGADYQVFAYV